MACFALAGAGAVAIGLLPAKWPLRIGYMAPLFSLMLSWAAAIHVHRHRTKIRARWLATTAWVIPLLAIAMTWYQPACLVLGKIPPIWGRNLPTSQATKEVQHILGELGISVPPATLSEHPVRGYVKGDSAYRKWYRVQLSPQETIKLQAALLAKVRPDPTRPKRDGPFLHKDFRRSDLLKDSPWWWKGQQLDDADCFVLGRTWFVLSVKTGEVYIFLSRFW
jgi:hypothetical protein